MSRAFTFLKGARPSIDRRNSLRTSRRSCRSSWANSFALLRRGLSNPVAMVRSPSSCVSPSRRQASHLERGSLLQSRSLSLSRGTSRFPGRTDGRTLTGRKEDIWQVQLGQSELDAVKKGKHLSQYKMRLSTSARDGSDKSLNKEEHGLITRNTVLADGAVWYIRPIDVAATAWAVEMAQLPMARRRTY